MAGQGGRREDSDPVSSSPNNKPQFWQWMRDVRGTRGSKAPCACACSDRGIHLHKHPFYIHKIASQKAAYWMVGVQAPCTVAGAGGAVGPSHYPPCRCPTRAFTPSIFPPRRPRSHGSSAVRHSVDEEDWEAEMGVFRQRTLAPNQLETLRKYEAGAVELGKVGLEMAWGVLHDAVGLQ